MDHLLRATALAEQQHFWFRGFRFFVVPLLEQATAGRPGLRLLDDDLLLFTAMGIHFDIFLPGLAAHMAVEGFFHSVLAHHAALVETGKFRLLQLLGGDFTDVAQEMGRRDSAGIVPLRLHLNHDAGKLQAVGFDQHGIALGSESSRRTAAVVVEMAMRGLGQVADLVRIATPQVGVVKLVTASRPGIALQGGGCP